MDVVGHCLHVGKARVGHDLAGGVAGGDPAIVDVHIDVPVVDHAAGDHGVGGVAHHLVVHAALPEVPTVPAHFGSQVQSVAADDGEGTLCLAQGVPRMKHDRIAAAIVQLAADVAGLRIDAQPGRQVFHGKGHGTLAGGGNREEKGRAGANAEDLRPVDPRRRRRRRGQDISLFVGEIDRPRLGAADQKAGVGPVAVGTGSVADVVDHQAQRLDASDVEVHGLGRLVPLQGAGLKEHLAVADDLEHDAVAQVVRTVIDAQGGQKAVAAAGQVDPHDAGGVGAHAVRKTFPGQAERRLADREVDLGRPPARRHLAHVQRAEPNGFGPPRGAGHRGQQQEGGQAYGETLGCNSHGDLPFFRA